MDSEKKIGELEERIKLLEEKLNHIVWSDNNTITISSCSFGTVEFGDKCEADFNNCTAGSVINCNFDDAEDELDEIEARIDDANNRMEELEVRIVK